VVDGENGRIKIRKVILITTALERGGLERQNNITPRRHPTRTFSIRKKIMQTRTLTSVRKKSRPTIYYYYYYYYY